MLATTIRLTVINYYNQTDSHWLLQSDWQSLIIAIRLTVTDYYNQTDSHWLLQSDWQSLTTTIRPTVTGYYHQTESLWLLQSVADYCNETNSSCSLYNIMWESLSVTCGRSVFSGYSNKINHHDIAEIILKVALNTLKQQTKLCLMYHKNGIDLFHIWFKGKKKTYYPYIHLDSKAYDYIHTFFIFWGELLVASGCM